MMHRAIVVHHDEATKRLLSSGLNIFEPGYRVATADNLTDATEWLGQGQPSLVVVGTDGNDPATIADWAEANQVDTADMVLVGSDFGGRGRSGFAAQLSYPLELSSFLSTVREITRANSEST